MSYIFSLPPFQLHVRGHSWTNPSKWAYATPERTVSVLWGLSSEQSDVVTLNHAKYLLQFAPSIAPQFGKSSTFWGGPLRLNKDVVSNRPLRKHDLRNLATFTNFFVRRHP